MDIKNAKLTVREALWHAHLNGRITLREYHTQFDFVALALYQLQTAQDIEEGWINRTDDI